MDAETLSFTAIPAIEADVTNKVDYGNIIFDFAAAKARENTIGCFFSFYILLDIILLLKKRFFVLTVAILYKKYYFYSQVYKRGAPQELVPSRLRHVNPAL